ncbi:MAG TPA: oligosaccharide flippase family protein [Azospirillum sp.]|nr:oligosaccharide flippase family protein [Azospirillum sp.]
MASEAATVFRHGWIYLVANIVNRAAGLLLLPLYTKVLTPTEFGIYGLIVVFCDLLAVMLMIGLNNAFTVVYFEYAEEPARRRVVSTCVLALSGAMLVLLALCWPIGVGLSWALFGEAGEARVIAIALGSIALTTVFELALAYYRVKKRSVLCLGISVAKAVALISLNALFLLTLEWHVEGIFLANAVAFAILGLTLGAVILAENGLGFSGAVLRRVVTLGLPYMPQSLLDITNNVVARWLLNVMLTTAAVGLFTFGLRLAQILFMFLTASFLQIWSVRRLEAQHEGEDRGQADLVFHLFLTLLTAAALGMALTTPEILWLIASPDYAPVLPCMPLLVLSFVLHGARMQPEVALMKAKRMAVLPWISAASLAVGTAMAVVMVTAWGLVGAALANLGRELFQIAVTEIVRRRLCPDEIPLDPMRLAAIVVPAAAVYVVGWHLFADAVDPAFTAAKVVLAAGFVAMAVFGPGLGREGRAALLKLMGGLARRAQSAA